MYTLDWVIITVGNDIGLCSWVFAVGHACLIVYRVMGAPTIMTIMLVVLFQRAEVPEGDG
jgi:hypothetical protein